MDFPYTQIRIARSTAKLDEIKAFYEHGLGLSEIGSFKNHGGYSGIMFGLPDARYHLEFTQHADGKPCLPPGRDNLLVFYLQSAPVRDTIVQRLAKMGYRSVPPENPYWIKNGITIEDPDGWRIVLMDVPAFDTTI
jgi:catechol 2,3-dioxygenase-like lactoylglutathione lyase family enzyme